MRQTHSLNVGDRTHLDLDVPSGSIEVRESRAGAVIVNIDADNADEWEVHQLGDSISVRFGRKRGWKSRAARILVDAPAGSHVEITSASADVSLVGAMGEVRVRTASGDVRAESVADDLDAGTASGDVRIGRCDGTNITVKSVSGDIVIGLPSGIRVEPDISSLSGRTSLPAPSKAPTDGPRRSVRLRLRTVSGNITVERVHPRP